MSKFVEGREHVTVGYRVNSKDVPVRETYNGTGRYAEYMEDNVNRTKVNVSSGRTISLGNYNFARVSVGMEVSVGDKSDKEEAFDAVKAVVDEILAREESNIRDEKRESVPLGFNIDCKCVVLYVDYGLTLAAKARFESNKIDISVVEPISDDEFIEDGYKRIQSFIEEKIVDEQRKLQEDGRGEYGF